MIKDVRKLKHISQEELARRTGLSQSHISELELNKESPTLRAVESIANVLEVHPYKLIEVTD